MNLANIVCESPVETKECYASTIVNIIKRKKQRAETELADANAALDALEKNPEVANILELISKVR